MSTDYEKYSDAELLQSYQKGNEVPGNVLFQRYGVPLHRFFKKRIRGSEEDVEDVLQETCLEALKSLKKIQAPKSFPAWLYTIARRILARWIKDKQQQSTHVSLDPVSADEMEQGSPAGSLPAPVTFQPEHGTLDNELGDIRRRFERTLSLEELAVFRLRQNSGMTFQEIGHELGIEPNTAKVRYHRVVTRFRAWLEKCYPDIYYSFIEGGG